MVITSFGLKSVTTKGRCRSGRSWLGAFLRLGAEAVLELRLLDDRRLARRRRLRREPASAVEVDHDGQVVRGFDAGDTVELGALRAAAVGMGAVFSR
jgi:hypothetical protein